eukprot:6136177-Amphidinium_carterae.1
MQPEAAASGNKKAWSWNCSNIEHINSELLKSRKEKTRNRKTPESPKIPPNNKKPVSYTHLRAHETEADL